MAVRIGMTSLTRHVVRLARRYSDVSGDLRYVVSSLTSERKRVPHWYMYDTRGSELFEEIARKSSTYNLWQHEYTLLQTHMKDIMSAMSSPATLVELGSGASSKTRPVIEAMIERQGALTYVPVDIAKDYIEEVSRELEREYSALKVEPFGGLFMDGLRHVAGRPEPKLLLFLGNSIGNVPIDEQVDMMKEIRTYLKAQDRFVLGLDLNTDRESVMKVYHTGDRRPWLENIIDRLNRDFDGNIDKMKFEPTTDFVQNPAEGDTPSYVERYLKNTAMQRVHLRKLGLDIDFPAGERLYLSDGPNYSCKFSEHQARRLAEKSNFAVEGLFANQEAKFCLVCLAPK
ncbi:histidine N-alpha-methyltransferase-like [Branchiostoma lanceolatum]|uniref:histidine N-alpha-methyltransferase-like n=1 Tax=Branchiostoma lanceolatum TaxID=7740 RepID=UPI0034522C4C